MITKMQVEHYQQKIKDMLKPQIEIVKLSLQDKRHKLVEETKKTLSKKMGIENKIKQLDKQEDDFEKMMSLMSGWLDKYVFCGLDATWSHPQFEIDYKFCGRVCSNVFYNTKTLPMHDINWTDIEISEDYNIALQLLTRGLANKVSTRYRVSPVDNFSSGGCSSYRTIELHNYSFLKLQKKFPSFVKLKEKVAKNSGEWSNKVKLAAIIQWKKAYESSQVNTLDAFMT